MSDEDLVDIKIQACPKWMHGLRTDDEGYSRDIHFWALTLLVGQQEGCSFVGGYHVTGAMQDL